MENYQHRQIQPTHQPSNKLCPNCGTELPAEKMLWQWSGDTYCSLDCAEEFSEVILGSMEGL